MGNLFLPIKIIISVSTNRRGEKRKQNNVTIVMIPLCHKTSMLMVKCSRRAEELCRHLDGITELQRCAQEWGRGNCCHRPS